MNACNDEVEACQYLLWIVERAVAEDVGLDALEDMKAAAEPLVQSFDRPLLDCYFLGRETSGVVRRLRMISQAKVGIAAHATGLGHILERVSAVRFDRVGVQDALQIVLRYELGKFLPQRELHFPACLAQLRSDV